MFSAADKSLTYDQAKRDADQARKDLTVVSCSLFNQFILNPPPFFSTSQMSSRGMLKSGCLSVCVSVHLNTKY